MTHEDYQGLNNFLEFTRIAKTFITLDHSNIELTKKSKDFFDDKIVLLPYYGDDQTMINVAFDPYVDQFEYEIIERNVVKLLNGTLHTAVRIKVKE